MEKILEKISEYELFNNLLPGTLFFVLLEWRTGVQLNEDDVIIKILVFYSFGLIIGRFGSLVVEPFCKFFNLIQFSDYSSYIIASERDPIIKTLSTKNNMYRTFLAMSILYTIIPLSELCINSFSSTPFSAQPIIETIGALLITYLFFRSYEKQTTYIRIRIKACTRENQRGD